MAGSIIDGAILKAVTPGAVAGEEEK